MLQALGLLILSNVIPNSVYFIFGEGRFPADKHWGEKGIDLWIGRFLRLLFLRY